MTPSRNVGIDTRAAPRPVENAQVEFYAGFKGRETPRAVVIDGMRLEVMSVLSRQRVLDAASGKMREVWHCGLADGRVATIELHEDGSRRVSI